MNKTLKGTITPKIVLKGTIKPQVTLAGIISKTVEKVERQTKAITINENGTVEVIPDANRVLEKVTVTTDVIGGNVEEYKGSYEITPSPEEQILHTALKVMRDDVKVKEIPYYEVSNASGGNTIIIS